MHIARVTLCLRELNAAPHTKEVSHGKVHFAMFETNRKEVFEVIRGWIESKLPPNPASGQTARG